MATTVLAREWDSAFFGARIFEAHLDDDQLESAVAEAALAGAQCLYAFVDGADLATIERAVRNGARLVDLRVEHDGPATLPPAEGLAPTRRATRFDRAVLVTQATALASESRFARDARIAEKRVPEMYEIWLDRCLDEGVVAVPEDGAGGFVGVRSDEGVARIELVYVDPAARTHGLGRALVRRAVGEVEAREVSVVTQTGNVPAQRLYESLGLRVRSTRAVLHVWLDEWRG